MSAKPYRRKVNHPYSIPEYDHFRPVWFEHAPYSAAAIPFNWMLKESVEGEKGIAHRLQLAYQPDREPNIEFTKTWVQEKNNQLMLLDTFFGALKEDESLCFFYAKRTPLSDDPRRVIVGVGRVIGLGQEVEYDYRGDPDRAGRMRGMLWERNVLHSIRPDFKDGFVLPYQDLLEAAERDPTIDLESCIAYAPEGYWSSYSFGSEHLGNDGAVASLLALAAALPNLQRHVEGDWEEQKRWIDREINRLWRMRGPFPGLGSALTALGVPNGTLVAFKIESVLASDNSTWNEDPWDLVSEALENPGYLGPEAGSRIGPHVRNLWKGLKAERRALLQLLSRFALTEDQATRFFVPAEREKAGISTTDAALLVNPYLIYQLDRRNLDAVPLPVIDRGLFPQGIVGDKFPVPEPSAVVEPIDPRRTCAHAVASLERAAAEGHTVQTRDWVIQTIRDSGTQPACAATPDLLDAQEQGFHPEISSFLIHNDETIYQLERFCRTKDIISKSVRSRLKGMEHKGELNWRKLIDAQFDGMPSPADPDQEELARTEKASALEVLFRSRISVLIGPAGTGKTTLLKALCELPEVRAGGVLPLAPTGKARVRLGEQINSQAAQTVAQFLLKLGRYDPNTGVYRPTGSLANRESRYKTVIIDEASMLTEEQLAAVLDGLADCHRLILVGDPRQLPPIGAGRPFLDIVTKLAPPDVERMPRRTGRGYAELTIRRRQAGENRDDLLLADWFGGRPMEAAADAVWARLSLGLASPNLEVRTWGTPEQLQDLVVEQICTEFGLTGDDDEDGFEKSLGGVQSDYGVFFWPHPKERSAGERTADSWQILSPVRADLHGVEAINKMIQARFRRRAMGWAKSGEKTAASGKTYLSARKTPKPAGRQGIVYGDKVINLKNDTRDCYNSSSDAKGYVANGEIGIVVGMYKGANAKYKGAPWKWEVEFTTQRSLKYDYWPSEFKEEGGDPLELAYALTVHKAQGSEFGVTFVVIPDPCRPLSRELLYTALTRQRDKVVLFHQGDITTLAGYGRDSRSEAARRLTNLFDPPRPVQIEVFGGEKRLFEEGLIHRTERGELVRSKSEVIIANMLYHMKVDYLYEEPLRGGDGSLRFPDFTIDLSAEMGIRVFIEHLGLLHDPDYRRRWEQKVEWYASNQITEEGGENGILIISRDGPNEPMDCPALKVRLEEVLEPIL